jgi:hypothetical protein
MVSGAYGKPDQRPASTASGRCPAGSSKVRKGMEPNNGRIHRLSRLGSIVKERASLVWKSASAHLRRVWLWLTVPRDPVDWKGALANASTSFQLRTIAARLVAGVVFVVLLAVIAARVGGALSWFWTASQADRDKVSPLLAPLASFVGTLATPTYVNSDLLALPCEASR